MVFALRRVEQLEENGFSVQQGARIAGLDGLRGVAIITVVLAHWFQRFRLLPFPLPLIDGVELFFVLSGFLITAILLREYDRTGGIRLLRFALRRALRILPPLAVYLAVVAGFYAACKEPVPWRSLGTVGLMLANLTSHPLPAMAGHLWSLSVEEQFYLLWPPALLFCLRFRGRRAAVGLALACVAASPLFRIGCAVLHNPFLQHRAAILLPGRMDSLLAGSLLALLTGNERFETAYGRLQRYLWLAPLYVLLISPTLRVLVGNRYTLTVGYTFEAFAAALLVAWLIRSPETRISRVLGWRPLALLGIASYSVYLYQSAVIYQWPAALGGHRPPVVLLMVLLTGFLAYVAVEAPVEWWRHRRRRKVQVARPSIAQVTMPEVEMSASQEVAAG